MTVKINTIFQHVQTERLILRTPTREDVPAVFAVHSDPKTNQYNPHGPMKSIDEAIERVDGWRRDWENDGFGYWSIIHSGSHEVMGFGGIRRMQWEDRYVLNLYYRLSAKSWGQGYATEVARIAVQLARKYLAELSVVARIRPVNTPSIKVAERVGMVLTPEINSSEFSVFTLGW